MNSSPSNFARWFVVTLRVAMGLVKPPLPATGAWPAQLVELQVAIVAVWSCVPLTR